jgi:heme-degrading monooxygenase HmoA
MITEQAILPVIPGQEDAFERAFAKARVIISSMPGFQDLSLSRSIESPNEYLLLVRWNSLEDHTVGFRGSTEYVAWRALLHRFYRPFPKVEHFVEVPFVSGVTH